MKRFLRTPGLSKITDRVAQWGISAAGAAVIAAMFLMLALIVREAAPLFFPARQQAAGLTRLPAETTAADAAAIGTESDPQGRFRTAGVILRNGTGCIAVLGNGTGQTFSAARLDGAPEGASIVSAEACGPGRWSVLWDDRTLSLYSLRMEVRDGGTAAPRLETGFVHELSVSLADDAEMPLFAMLRGSAENYRAVGVYAGGRVTDISLRPGKGLLARGKGTLSRRETAIRIQGELRAAALSSTAERLYLGTDGGDIISLDFAAAGTGEVPTEITPAFRDRRAVTALSFLSGDYALAAGDARGGVSVWFPRREEGQFRLRRSAEWPGLDGRIESFAVSGRDRGFFALDAAGGLHWLYSTNARKLLDIPPAMSPAAAAALNSRADMMLTLHADGGLVFHDLNSSYPEAGWSGFFSRLLYEGYETPGFVWQSTGSDASEPKLSLVPLIFGSIKAAVYALLFAVPIALAAAMYLSQFSSPEWRARLKPAVEMLAAIPSVVIGFIAALWLAPLLERHLQFIIKNYPYDQRNSLVIAIAMGFAVIPTIFSLAEDAISAVPPSLSAASLALGASKWQTVWRVVLPTASPGIFTAAMLGFGRAVGETMIVLMAAGNTPIISLSPFNGMRTLSANIAVEMPEAPVGGTLYRTLFLCALILFVLTLIINTAAEIFRHRLRRRYGRL